MYQEICVCPALGQVQALRGVNNIVLTLQMLILFLMKALKWPFSLQKAVGSMDKWSANRRPFHLDGKGQKTKMHKIKRCVITHITHTKKTQVSS